MARLDLRRSGQWTGGSLALLPFESPESALWKFAWANEITLSQCYSLFDKALTNCAAEAFDVPPNWANALNGWAERTEGLSRPLICDWLYDDDDLLFETNTLRFCPICFEAGYHSWWHQCHVHAVCLLHGCRLECGCMSCGTPVAIDRCGRSSFRRPYICPHCSNPLAGVEPAWATMDDLAALRGALVYRYGVWMCWFEKLATLRRNWHRVFGRWYAVVPDERLANARSSRERAALLQMCPPPAPVVTGIAQSVVTTVIVACNVVDYDPEFVIQQFLASTVSMFDATDWEQYRQCQTSIRNGQRVQRGTLRTAPLAVWIVRLYTEFCLGLAKKRSYRELPTRKDCVDALNANVGLQFRVDANGLHEVLMALYAETFAWLDHSSTREVFDLELARFMITPGISAYLVDERALGDSASVPEISARQIDDPDRHRTLVSVVLVRPRLPADVSPAFSLQRDGNRDLVFFDDRDDWCIERCWRATSPCSRPAPFVSKGSPPPNPKATQTRGRFPMKQVSERVRGVRHRSE